MKKIWYAPNGFEAYGKEEIEAVTSCLYDHYHNTLLLIHYPNNVYYNKHNHITIQLFLVHIIDYREMQSLPFI